MPACDAEENKPRAGRCQGDQGSVTKSLERAEPEMVAAADGRRLSSDLIHHHSHRL